MIRYTTLFIQVLLLPAVLSVTSCRAAKDSSASVVFTGSTPADAEVRTLLTIPQETKIDFIRWKLVLGSANDGQGRFTLDINYGEGKPNTLLLKGGGEKLSLSGKYRETKADFRSSTRQIVVLEVSNQGSEMRFARLNGDLIHLLSKEDKLMIGNAGWSYTLNRESPVGDRRFFPGFEAAALLLQDTASVQFFDGRTPCRTVAEEYGLQVDGECFKIKWSLELRRDPATLQPTSFRLRSTFSRATEITGKWTIETGMPSSPGAVIYRLEASLLEKPLLFLLADENILLLLDSHKRLLIGNNDFSYTLNRHRR